MQKSKPLKRNVEVTETSEQMVRITFTIGISGRFIDMTHKEAKEVLSQLSSIIN